MKNRNLPYILIALLVLGNGTIQTFFLGERTGTTTISVIVIILGIYFYYSVRRINRNKVYKMRLLLPLLLYVFVFAINVAFVGHGFSGDYDTRRWIIEILQPLIMYLVVFSVCLRDGDIKIRNLLIGLMVVESLMSIVGIIASGSLGNIAEMSKFGESISRDYEQFATGHPGSLIAFGAGTFEQSNLLGAFLVLLLPQLIFRWKEFVQQDFRQIFLLSIIISAILLTFSRSTWLGFFLTIIMMIFTSGGFKKIWPIISFGIILILIIYLSPVLQSRLMDVSTIVERTDLRDIGIYLFTQRPWFGYRLAFFSSFKGPTLIVNPHNDYVTRLIGGGIVGFIAFMIPFIVILIVSLRSWISTSDKNIRMKAAMAFITCFIFMILMAFNPIQELFYFVPIAFAIFEAERNNALARY